MKKALSLLLAVLMLVSLFSGMAFADDDVIVEEPVAVDEIVGDDFAEAADAYVEEYTDEGSFEAADELAIIEWNDFLKDNNLNWEIEYMEPEKPVCGQYVKIHCRDGVTQTEIANPTTVLWNHMWVTQEEYDALPNPKPSLDELGWKTTSVVDATCEKDGVMHQERVCTVCEKKETRDVVLHRLGHTWGTDPLSTAKGNYDPDWTATMPKTKNAILVMPTRTKEGLGHEVCINCGGLNPDTEDYVIGPHNLPADNHTEFMWEDWTIKVSPRCSAPGYKERVCIIEGCPASQDQQIDALTYYDPNTKKIDFTKGSHDFADEDCMMVFDHIERLNCKYYAEVWVCSNPNCYSKWNAKDKKWEASETASQYVQYVGEQGQWDTLEDAIANADLGFDYLVETKHNTELYLHHRYEDDFVIEDPAGCCHEGTMSRSCTEKKCPDRDGSKLTYPIPALEPIYGDDITIVYDQVNDQWYHYKSCTRPECVKADPPISLAPEFPDPQTPVPDRVKGLVYDPTDENYYTQANNLNKQALVVGHEWGEWNVEVPVTATQRGHLFRTCMIPGCGGRMDFFGNQAEFDAKYNPPHPVLPTGIYKDEDGAFRLYEMGVFDEDFTGIYNGYNHVLDKDGKWYVVEGIWENDAMGATLVGSTWYFLANGKVQEVTQLAEYQGKWFYVVNGVIDTSKTALVDYNGGKFVVALGRIVDEYSGLWQNAKSIGGDDSWYYVAKGQVQTQYTGLVQYNGEWFYVENGQLVPYNGEVEYDGEIFNVKEGMVVAA